MARRASRPPISSPLFRPPPISRSAIIRVNPRVARKSPHLNHAAISQLVVLGCSRRSIINYRDHSNDRQGRGGLSSLIQFSANRRGCVERCGVTEPRENSRAYYRPDRGRPSVRLGKDFEIGWTSIRFCYSARNEKLFKKLT